MPSEEAPPALFNHACAVYEKMYSQSRREQADGVTTMIVYEGMLTKLMTEELGLPVPYFTRIRGKLLGMGCIRQLRRGGGSSPSQWELIKEPSFEDWVDSEEVVQTPQQEEIERLGTELRLIMRHIQRLEDVTGLRDIPLPRE